MDRSDVDGCIGMCFTDLTRRQSGNAGLINVCIANSEVKRLVMSVSKLQAAFTIVVVALTAANTSIGCVGVLVFRQRRREHARKVCGTNIITDLFSRLGIAGAV